MAALFTLDPNVVQNAAGLTLEQKAVLRSIVDSLNDAVDVSALEADLVKLTGITNGTQAANKAVVADDNVNTGVSKVTQLHIGVSGSETQVTASGTELNALDNATAANGTTGKAAILGTDGAITFAGAVTEQVVGLTSAGVGAVNGGTVTVVEQGSGGIHKTVLTLTGTPVTLTDDPGNGAYAALKLYDFPAGNIVTLGGAINADATLSETWWVDDKAGDVGLGTVATAVGTALTGTTQNIIATTATTSLAQVSGLDTQSTGVGTSGAAGGTDADIVLNFRVDDDALHFPDLVTNGTFTGNATGWTLGADWAYGTNNVAATLASTAMTQTPAAPTILAGISYSLVFDATATAGSVQASVGGTLGTARSTSATFTETFIAGADGVLSFTGTGFSGTIDNVVLTPLTGSGAITGTVTVAWVNAGDF